MKRIYIQPYIQFDPLETCDILVLSQTTINYGSDNGGSTNSGATDIFIGNDDDTPAAKQSSWVGEDFQYEIQL